MNNTLYIPNTKHKITMNLLKYDSKIMYDVLLPMIKNRRYLNVVMTTYGIYIYGHDLFVRITMGEPMPASRACEPVFSNCSSICNINYSKFLRFIKSKPRL